MSDVLPDKIGQAEALRRRVLRARIVSNRILRPGLLHQYPRVLLDGICGSLAVLLAYVLRFDMHPPLWAQHEMWIWTAVLFFLDPLALSLYGGYRSTWQHAGISDLRGLIVRFAALNSCLFLAASLSRGLHIMPYGVVCGDFLLVLVLSGGVRLIRRLNHEASLRLSAGQRIVVVGTENTIAEALRQLLPLYGASIQGIVLEGENLKNRNVLGVPVLGEISNLAAVIRSQKTTLLLFSSANLHGLPELLHLAASLDIRVKMLPSVHDLLDDRVRVTKPVAASALGSQLVIDSVLHPGVAASLRDKVVLITGAGGSIGSELARQVSTAHVRLLLLLDQDENAVFELLSGFGASKKVEPVIATIRDREALEHVFSRYHPDVVLHAAAYKHVPMMEGNPCEAVLNNVMGTRVLAETALQFGAERFVMISSDKAVRPSSVMGATKRLAEVVIQQIARRQHIVRTDFACVRFGNVLGSRGSVLPMFLKQIEAGGPLTVTHEDMTRYFMTIPQAVHLVLQASTLGSRGHIYMLEMGDPVRIVNFARQVIQLAGLTPDKDIEIRIVGSRPGEKLHEQLWTEGAKITPTIFDQVFEVYAEDPDLSFPALLDELESAACNHRSHQIRSLLRALPIDYSPERSVTYINDNSVADALPPNGSQGSPQHNAAIEA